MKMVANRLVMFWIAMLLVLTGVVPADGFIHRRLVNIGGREICHRSSNWKNEPLNTLEKDYSALHMVRNSEINEPLELSEENVRLVLDEIRSELGTIFGYDQGSQQAGITGEIEYQDIDGGNVIVSLKGRFWHATDTIMMRVDSFLRQRIPEIIEVVLDTEKSSIVDDNRLNTENSSKSERKLF